MVQKVLKIAILASQEAVTGHNLINSKVVSYADFKKNSMLTSKSFSDMYINKKKRI